MVAKNKLVLVVDDDPRMLRLFENVLNVEEYGVITVSSGKEALALLNDISPDVVLLDRMMPGMDGYTLCRHIREFSQVPVIMVITGNSHEEMVKATEAGVDDFLHEPFSYGDLLTRLEAVLSRPRSLFSLERLVEFRPETGIYEQGDKLYNESQYVMQREEKVQDCSYLTTWLLKRDKARCANRFESIALNGKDTSTWAEVGVAG